jgi:hypothetical protein
VPRVRYDAIHKRLVEDNSRPATLQAPPEVRNALKLACLRQQQQQQQTVLCSVCCADLESIRGAQVTIYIALMLQAR